MRFVNKTAGSHFANRFCVEVFARNVYTEWSFTAKPQVRFWEIKSVSTFWPLVDVLAQNLNTDRTSAGNVHIEPASPPPPRSPAFFAIQDSCNLRRAVAEGLKRIEGHASAAWLGRGGAQTDEPNMQTPRFAAAGDKKAARIGQG